MVLGGLPSSLTTESTTRVWVVPSANGVVITTMSITAHSNLSSSERAIIISCVNDCVVSNSETDPLLVVKSIRERFVTQHIHTGPTGQNQCVLLNTLWVSKSEQKIQYSGDFPAWVAREGELIPLLPLVDNGGVWVQPASQELHENDSIYLVTTGEPSLARAFGNECFATHLMRTLGALGSIPFGSQAEVIGSSMEMWKSMFDPSVEVFIMGIKC